MLSAYASIPKALLVSPFSPFGRGFLTCQRRVDGAGPTQVLHGDSGDPAEAQSRHITLSTSGKKGRSAGSPRASGVPLLQEPLAPTKAAVSPQPELSPSNPAEHVTAPLRTSQLRTDQGSLRFPARPVHPVEPPNSSPEHPPPAPWSPWSALSHSSPPVMSPSLLQAGHTPASGPLRLRFPLPEVFFHLTPAWLPATDPSVWAPTCPTQQCP